MYYGYHFDRVEYLMTCIDEYIDYYNNDRIKVKLKGLAPVEYRNQALETALQKCLTLRGALQVWAVFI